MQSDQPQPVSVEGAIPLTRAAPDELLEEVRAMAHSAVVRALLEVTDAGLLVLNAHRQIVAANLRGLVEGPDSRVEELLGLRPGEALGCSFAKERPGGCGASEACRTCGAVATILGCQRSGQAREGECLIPTPSGTRELSLRASPLEVAGRRFTVVALRDQSHEKRRRVLEQAFLHDLANLVSPLSTTAALVARLPDDQLRGTAERMARLVGRVDAEIHAQRALLQAERGNLALAVAKVRPGELLDDLHAAFEAHPAILGRSLRIESGPDRQPLATDRALVLRVLANMATNALEATPEGGAVSVWAEAPSTASRWACGFHVHNDGAIPKPVALRIFQRSFSTKAQRGRGIGTYSMKLLGERYLGGEVSFTTGEEEGTTFSLWLPERAPSR